MASAAQRLLLSKDLALSAALGFGVSATGPVLLGGQLQPVPALFAGAGVIVGLRYAGEWLLVTADWLDRIHVHRASGKDGTAAWATLKDLLPELNRHHEGPFWGAFKVRRRWGLGFKRVALVSDFVSNAFVVAPAGSGKTSGILVPSALGIRHSKFIIDHKGGELAGILKKPLEKRGERVLILNAPGFWPDQLGRSEQFNVLTVVISALETPGGLVGVIEDLRELAEQLIPEPEKTGGDNRYWQQGSRDCIAFAALLECIVEVEKACLPDVGLLLEDREKFEFNLRWVVGVDLKGKPLPECPMPIERAPWAVHHDAAEVARFAERVRAEASGLLALIGKHESKTLDSFLSGAQQAVKAFTYGNIANAMRASTFTMDMLKEGPPTTIFVVGDPSRNASYKLYFGLMQWAANTALKRHPDKARPVYNLLDEATNFSIHDLPSLLTYGRGFGIRNLLSFQSLSAFERVYGKAGLGTLLSESEIAHYLPGTREPETLKLIAQQLGNQSVMSAALSKPKDEYQEQLSESSRPLMTRDEIRRSQQGFLFIRRQPPALVEPVAYSAIAPHRRQADINPFIGKPFLRRVKLRLKRRWWRR